MLRLFRLLARGAAADAERDLLDRNALLILDQQIRETRVSLERSRLMLGRAVAGDKVEAGRQTEIETRAKDLEERAVAALAAGREDLAAEAAEAIADLEAEHEALRTARTRFASEIVRIRAVVADASRRQAELERGRRVAAASEAVRRLREEDRVGDRATLREAEATLARLQALQTEASETEAVLRDADEPGLDIAAKLEREGFGRRTHSTASTVMDRLRRRTEAATQPA